MRFMRSDMFPSALSLQLAASGVCVCVYLFVCVSVVTLIVAGDFIVSVCFCCLLFLAGGVQPARGIPRTILSRERPCTAT